MSLQHLNFLVVEDDDLQREAVATLLRNLGAAAVHEAEDGASALRIVHDPDRPCDIVVTDLFMPGMDGMEFIRKLGESGSGASVIVSSSLEPQILATVANMTQAYGLSLLGVIQKPVKAVKLAPLVEMHLARHATTARDGAATGFSGDEIRAAWSADAFAAMCTARVGMANRELVAVQVDPCWIHPQRGTLRPADFHAALVAQRLHEDLMWRTLSRASSYGAQLHAAGVRVRVAVELDAAALLNVRFAELASVAVVKEGFEPRHIIFGVAEEAIDTDVARALESMARLRMLGFGLCIDRFGTGHMAPEELSRAAFTHMRLDPSLVRNAGTDEGVRAGLAVGLDIARRLGAVVVADGVATQKDWDLLLEWGCDTAQGPFVRDPMPFDKFFLWAQAQVRDIDPPTIAAPLSPM